MTKFFTLSLYNQRYFHKEGKKILYKKGEALVRPEDPALWVYFLEDGVVRVKFSLEDGTEGLIGFLVKGATFAKSGSFFNWHSSGLVYEAIEDSVVYRVPIKEFLSRLPQDIQLSQNYNQVIARNNLFLIDRIVYQACKGTKKKFVKWLLFMANYYGVGEGNKKLIPVPLTQDDISDFLHATRESTNKVMTELLRKGYIARSQKKITILDIEKLYTLL